MPEPMPLGLTFLLAIVRATVSASFVKSNDGGNVETVFTSWDQRLVCVCFGVILSHAEEGAKDVPQ
jgi:hypothetical protein